MKRSTLSSLCLISTGFLMVIAFQNCSKVGFTESSSGIDLKAAAGGRDPGADPTAGTPRDPGLDPNGNPRDPGKDPNGADDRDPGKDPNNTADRDPGVDTGSSSDVDTKDSEDWLYIPHGRGHVPMSSVAVCPADSPKDAGKQECPFFCFHGVDMQTTRDEAADYFAKHFDRSPDYGGGAVPGTCANPDLKTKR